MCGFSLFSRGAGHGMVRADSTVSCVVAVPMEYAAEILSKAQAAAGKEQQTHGRLATSENIFDIQRLGDVR